MESVLQDPTCATALKLLSIIKEPIPVSIVKECAKVDIEIHTPLLPYIEIKEGTVALLPKAQSFFVSSTERTDQEYHELLYDYALQHLEEDYVMRNMIYHMHGCNQTKDIEKYVSALMKYSRLSSLPILTVFYIALTLRYCGFFDLFTSFLSLCVNTFPTESPILHYLSCKHLLEGGKMEESKSHIEKAEAMASTPFHEYVCKFMRILWKSVTGLSKNETDELYNLVVLEVGKQHPVFHFYVAMLYISILREGGDIAKTEEMFLKYLALPPQLQFLRPEYDFSRAYLYREQMKKEEAMVVGKEALEFSEKMYGKMSLITAEAYNCCGNVCVEIGDLKNSTLYYQAEKKISSALHSPPHPCFAALEFNFGRIAEAGGCFEHSLECFMKSLSMHKQCYGDGPHQELATLYVQINLVLQELDRKDEALSYALQAAEMAEVCHEKSLHSNISYGYSVVGGALLELDRAEEAEPYLRKGLTILEELGLVDTEVYATSLSTLAAALIGVDKAEEALPLMEKAMPIFRQVTPEGGANMATALGILGSVHLARGYDDLGRQCLLDCAVMLADTFGDYEPIVLTAFVDAAVHFTSDCDFYPLMYALEDYLDTPVEHIPSTALAELFKWYGEVHIWSGLIENGLKNIAAGLAMLEEVDDEDTSNAMVSLLLSYGTALAENNMREEAFPIAEEAEAALKKCTPETPNMLASDYIQVSAIFLYLEEYERAIRLISTAIEILETCDDPHSLGEAYNALGCVYVELDNLTASMTAYKKALEVLQDYYPNDNNALIGTTFQNLGDLLVIQGDTVSAINMYMKSHSISVATGGERSYSAAVALRAVAKVMAAKGDFSAALKVYVEVCDIHDCLLQKGSRHAVEAAQVWNEIGEVYMKMYENEPARKYLLRTIELLNSEGGSSLGLEGEAGLAYLRLGKISFSQFEVDDAKDYFQKGIAILEKVCDEQDFTMESLRNMLAELESFTA